MKTLGCVAAAICAVGLGAACVDRATSQEVFNSHAVMLDGQGKLLPWYGPAGRAYDHFVKLRWQFIKTRVPQSPGPAPRSDYPQYFFYCAYLGQERQVGTRHGHERRR